MLSVVACNKADLTSDKGKASYAVGYNIARNMKQQGIEIDPNTMAAAMADTFAGKAPQLSDVEMQLAIQKFSTRGGGAPASPETLAKNKEYLDANKAKPGVVVTASGLQYKIINAGSGASPKVTNTVKVNYRGTLMDGTEFDSSYKRGQPAEFGVGQVIKGWTEALKLMPVGSKYKLYIPQELAYGSQNMGNIKPFSALIFEVELISIEK